MGVAPASVFLCVALAVHLSSLPAQATPRRPSALRPLPLAPWPPSVLPDDLCNPQRCSGRSSSLLARRSPVARCSLAAAAPARLTLLHPLLHARGMASDSDSDASVASVSDTLSAAVWQGDVEELRRLLADPAAAAAVDWAALYDALHAAHDIDGPDDKASCTQCFRLLLDAAPGAAAARDSSGKTLLHTAAEFGLLDAAELLLERAPQTAAAVDSHGDTPLHSAISGLRDIGCYEEESRRDWREGSMVDTLLFMHRLLRAAPSVLSMRSGYGKTAAELAYSLIDYKAEDGEGWEDEHPSDMGPSQSQQLVSNAALAAARTLLAAHSRGEAGARCCCAL